MSEALSKLTKTHSKPTSTFHGSRLDHLPGGKLRHSKDPQIKDLPTSNSDMLFGTRIYTALRLSAQNYAERRQGGLFEVDITGKNFFDYRKLNALFNSKNRQTKMAQMFCSQNEKVCSEAQAILAEIKYSYGFYSLFRRKNSRIFSKS